MLIRDLLKEIRWVGGCHFPPYPFCPCPLNHILRVNTLSLVAANGFAFFVQQPKNLVACARFRASEAPRRFSPPHPLPNPFATCRLHR